MRQEANFKNCIKDYKKLKLRKKMKGNSSLQSFQKGKMKKINYFYNKNSSRISNNSNNLYFRYFKIEIKD